ncbi:hypothetical protein IE53DRAFT_46391 [Violaceomyces palustris]|uniref:Uncharacterized protein n=1 Tax=Violaceomyces palustris TaxID=1673888 RepID=A0ACD0P0N6_9BASI|nr:hypothetical protein IE53DRAFT_46391 [Violaceomyces palustris]
MSTQSAGGYSNPASPEKPSSPTTSPSKQRHRRHARTPASLTSSFGGSGSSAYLPMDLDPMSEDPDQVFTKLPVKQVELFHLAVRDAAAAKRQELRSLVGERYTELLGTANTIIDMAHSSSQLKERLGALKLGVRKDSFGDGDGDLSGHDLAEEEFLRQQREDQVFSIGASLKLLMDAPEFVWRSIEKGKTLTAAWTFILARVVWWDLMERRKPSNPEDLTIDVKAAFPFVEKQWQGLVPMRKQIIQRAVDLLAIADLGLQVTMDQLATVILLDNLKIPQAFSLLLSQRRNAIKEILRISHPGYEGRNRRRSSVVFGSLEKEPVKEKGPGEDETEIDAMLSSLIRSYMGTLIHASRSFALPGPSPPASFPTDDQSTLPCMHQLLKRLTQPPPFAGTEAGSSLKDRRTSFIAPGGLSPAALKAARRRSSLGVPTLLSDPSHSDKKLSRVSTHSVLHSLPSSSILTHFLPPQILSFTPYVEVDEPHENSEEGAIAKIQSWAAQIRQDCLYPEAEMQDTKGRSQQRQSISDLLKGLQSIRSISRVQHSSALNIEKAHKFVMRKIGSRPGGSTPKEAKVLEMIKTETEELRRSLDALFEARLASIYQQELDGIKSEAVASTERSIRVLAGSQASQDGGKSKEEADVMFERHPTLFLFSSDSVAPSQDDRPTLASRAQKHSNSASRPQAIHLNDRLETRSPMIDKVIRDIDMKYEKLERDMEAYFGSLRRHQRGSKRIEEAFSERAAGTLVEIVKAWRAMLQDMSSVQGAEGLDLEGSEKDSARKEAAEEESHLFVGRLALCAKRRGALHAALQRPRPCATRDELCTVLDETMLRSLDKWKSRVSRQCITILSSIDYRNRSGSGGTPPYPTTPSPSLISALSLIGRSCLDLGLSSFSAESKWNLAGEGASGLWFGEKAMLDLSIDILTRWAESLKDHAPPSAEQQPSLPSKQACIDQRLVAHIFEPHTLGTRSDEASFSRSSCSSNLKSTLALLRTALCGAESNLKAVQDDDAELAEISLCSLSRHRLLLGPLLDPVEKHAFLMLPTSVGQFGVSVNGVAASTNPSIGMTANVPSTTWTKVNVLALSRPVWGDGSKKVSAPAWDM